MSGCLFCRIAARSEPAHLVLETDRVVGFLDNRPVFKGHVLLVTRRPVETLTELPDELLAPFFAATRAVAAAIRDSLGAQGSSDAITLG
ncbi:MAG: HIT family protein [Nocardioidaceae bacterium]|nr:HIT family protein [Nocardioidaceae bacterium]